MMNSLSYLSERIELIIQALSNRSEELYNNSKIEFILPFENKGKEIGVTLDHPHGQIYSFGHIPELIKRQAISQKSNPLENLLNIPKELILKKFSAISFVPRWARYPLKFG